MRTLALLLAIACAPAPAVAWCVLACDRVTVGPDARVRAQAILTLALPQGAFVIGTVEGGFQDRFAQARVEVPEADLDAVLGALGLARGVLRTPAGEDFGPSGAEWFDPVGRPGLLVAPVSLRHFDSAILGVAPGGLETDWTLYIWAFET